MSCSIGSNAGRGFFTGGLLFSCSVTTPWAKKNHAQRPCLLIGMRARRSASCREQGSAIGNLAGLVQSRDVSAVPCKRCATAALGQLTASFPRSAKFGPSSQCICCWKHCTLDCNCVIVLLVFSPFFWLWLEARGFFIDYSAGFRLRHSGG